MWDHAFYGDFTRNGKRAYLEHYNRVRRLVPKENLLEYSVAEGWSPLCKFLELDVPEQSFPNGNNSQDFYTYCRLEDKERLRVVLSKLPSWSALTLFFATIALLLALH